MAGSSLTEVEKQLAAIQLTFKNSLPAKMTKIEQLCQDFSHTEKSNTIFIFQ